MLTVSVVVEQWCLNLQGPYWQRMVAANYFGRAVASCESTRHSTSGNLSHQLILSPSLEINEEIFVSKQTALLQLHNPFQSEFFRYCLLLLPVSVSGVLSFPYGHPVGDYDFFLVFPLHIKKLWFILSPRNDLLQFIDDFHDAFSNPVYRASSDVLAFDEHWNWKSVEGSGRGLFSAIPAVVWKDWLTPRR